MSSQIAEQISAVPELYEKGDMSTATLLKRTGYLEQPQSLAVGDVEEALAHAPRLVDRWLKRGRDQRLVGGWGIESEGARYWLQSYATGQRRLEDDRLHAVAEFIVRYVSFIAEVLNRHRGHMAVRR